MTILWLDLETYSRIPIANGAYKYAEDARILLFSYAIDDEPARVVDVEHNEPYPPRVLDILEGRTPATLIAHNSQFDRTVLKKFFPAIADPRTWKDSMIKAYSLSLPGALGDLCEYYGLPVDKAKDKDGRRLVAKFCIPPKEGKTPARMLPGLVDHDWAHFVDYARLDVEAMRELWHRMPDYNDTPAFWAQWHIDQAINDRGMGIDVELARAAIIASADVKAASDKTVKRITDGAIQTAGQRDALLSFLASVGVTPKDMRKTTLEGLLADDATPEVARELIRARLYSAKASVKKFETLCKATGSDGHLRGCLLYCGAQRTGRWAGRLFQPQNLPRGSLTPEQVETAIDAIKCGISGLLYDDVNSVISSCLRGSIQAPKGKKLVVADLSNIEGRVLAWLAHEEWKLSAFREFDAGRGVDLYKATYARTFGIDPADVTKKQRQVGKVLELAMGYMGGTGSFLAFAQMYGVDLDDLAERTFESLDAEILEKSQDQYAFFAEKDLTHGMSERLFVALNAIKLAWRDAHPGITTFWKSTGNAFKRALGIAYDPMRNRVKVERVGGNNLRAILPSGRSMMYPRVKLPDDGKRALFSYYGKFQQSGKWGPVYTHEGKCVENITQAVARDVLAENLARIEAAGYKIILSVHDELITETPDSPEFNCEALSAMMATPPKWAFDLPLAAAGFDAYRYKKD